MTNLRLFILILSVYYLASDTNAYSRTNLFGKIPHNREKRKALLFYETSVIQFICGFGIPVEDLDYESVTSGLVFKATFALPNNLSYFLNPTEYNGDGGTDNTDSADRVRDLLENESIRMSQARWNFYRLLEQLSEKMGQPGRLCVLKSICEASDVPFSSDGGILAELANILLSPSSSKDKISSEHVDYFKAEALGRNGGGSTACEQSFGNCSSSLLAQFSHVYEFANSLLSTIENIIS